LMLTKQSIQSLGVTISRSGREESDQRLFVLFSRLSCPGNGFEPLLLVS
jgi:hypothetical protein